MEREYPILEFDPARKAIINPRRSGDQTGDYRHAVLCFFQDVVTRLSQERQVAVVTHFDSEIGKHPVYELAVEDKKLLVLHPGVGAPLAAGLLESVIALGCTHIVACGGAGVLDSGIAAGHIVVPSAAVRDEGTSYHYLPPSREVEADPIGVATVEAVLERHGHDYRVGKTWSTDAYFRETPDKVRRRRAEGCIVVEMEAAAFFAVARFRGVRFAHLLYGGDDVSQTEWDARDWTTHSVRETLFWRAVEACLAME